MILWGFLTEILKSSQTSSQFLYLIKNNKGFAWYDILACNSTYGKKNTLHIIVLQEYVFCHIIVVTIYVSYILKFLFAKFS